MIPKRLESIISYVWGMRIMSIGCIFYVKEDMQ